MGEKRQILETVLTGLMGAIVGILLVNVLRVFNEITVSLALFGLFLYIMTIVHLVRFSGLRNDVKGIVSKKISSRLLRGRAEIYSEIKRIFDSSRKGAEILMIAIGADLSNDETRRELTPYLKSIEKSLKRGVIFYRIQTIEDAPVRWLQHIHEILSKGEYNDKFHIKVTKEALMGFYS